MARRKGKNQMTDYTKFPLGPLAADRIGKIIECPICGNRGLEIEDYVNPMSGSTEKETFCLHSDNPIPIEQIKNGRTVTVTHIVEVKCPIPKSNNEPKPA